MAETVLDNVKRASGWSIVLGILMIVAGILAILAPLIAGVVIVYVVAWTAIFNGGAQIVYGFRAHGGGRMALEILLGLLYIAAGVFILMHPAGGLLALTLIIACFLLVYGVFALVLAFPAVFTLTQPQALADDAAKKKLVVGFSQVGAESGWRTANTESIKSEAQKRGIDLRFSDAQQKEENQIKAIRSFIAEGVDVIAFSPVVETGFEPVLQEAKKAGIPVVLSDRAVKVSDPSLYVTFLGSDFVEEGRRAAEAVAKLTGGKANIAELVGTVGSAPAIDRKKGFEEVLTKYPDMKIIMSQSGDFTRAKGKEVMEAFLKAPNAKDINVLFAHNDDMALGAIQAMEEAGIKPGQDIKIVSIDGVRGAFEAMKDGKLNVTVECNPLLGPQLFDLIEKVANKEEIPKRVVSQEGVYEQSQAAAELPKRQY